MQRIAYLAAAFSLLTSTACLAQAREPGPQTSTMDKDPTAWLEYDCEDVDSKAALRYADALPRLASAVQAGIPASRRELIRQSLAARYDELAAQAKRKPERKLASTREQFIERDLRHLDALYRVRAAQALAAIGGPDARTALESGLAKAPTDSVREALERSIAKLR